MDGLAWNVRAKWLGLQEATQWRLGVGRGVQVVCVLAARVRVIMGGWEKDVSECGSQ